MMDKIIKLELTVKEIDLALLGISKLPLGDVLDLFNKIRTQSLEQLQPPAQDSGA